MDEWTGNQVFNTHTYIQYLFIQVTSTLIINSLKRAAPVITSVQRFWGGVDDDDDLDDNSINRINRVNTRLQGLIK